MEETRVLISTGLATRTMLQKKLEKKLIINISVIEWNFQQKKFLVQLHRNCTKLSKRTQRHKYIFTLKRSVWMYIYYYRFSQKEIAILIWWLRKMNRINQQRFLNELHAVLRSIVFNVIWLILHRVGAKSKWNVTRADMIFLEFLERNYALTCNWVAYCSRLESRSQQITLITWQISMK